MEEARGGQERERKGTVRSTGHKAGSSAGSGAKCRLCRAQNIVRNKTLYYINPI